MTGAKQPDGEVHFVVPGGIDDPQRPSGGNVYDRRVSAELPRLGWVVHEHQLPGSWPEPDQRARDLLEAVLAGLPPDSVVLVDGLIASAAEALVDAARQLRIVVLLHMPLAETSTDDAGKRVETAVLNAAAGVITTSEWARQWVIKHLGVQPDHVWAATPGVDAAPLATGTVAGTGLMCVGPVTSAKGHDLLIAALKQVSDLDWSCTCVGALDLDVAFVDEITQAAELAGLTDRLVFTGPLSRPRLDELRSQADLLVSPSRHESYGMAVTEALAGGTPVVATDVGGHREALGNVPDGTLPGLLIPAGDAAELADALRTWLTDPDVRGRWRESAVLRSRDLPGWPDTARTVADVLSEIHANPGSAPAQF